MRFVTKIAVFAASVKASDPTLSLDAPVDKRELTLECEGADALLPITLSREAARMSGLLVNVMDTSDKLEVRVKPLELGVDCDCTAVGHAVEYMMRHHGKELPEVNVPLRGPDLTKNGVSEEDANWIGKIDVRAPHQDLVKLINAANYLDINPLLKLASARVASHYMRLHGNHEEFRKEFGRTVKGDDSKETAQKAAASTQEEEPEECRGGVCNTIGNFIREHLPSLW
jgi:hypothetical protein